MSGYHGSLLSGISEEVYAELTKSGVCYDFIPSSTKIVVFDTRLRVSVCLHVYMLFK